MKNTIVVAEIEAVAEIDIDIEVVHIVIEDIIAVIEEAVIAVEVAIESMATERKILVPWMQVWKKR